MDKAQFQQINHPSGITGAVASLIGGRSENQDSFLAGATPLGLMVIVCDGMGGGPAGKTASSMAADVMFSTAIQARPGMNPGEVLRAAAVAANKAVYDAALADPSLRGMGTTCVALLLHGAYGYIVHVGDSRCYQLRGGKKVFRTSDHSMVAEMVRKGTLTEEAARTSNFSNVITRAIGGEPEVKPDVDVVNIRPGDRFALMTDGIWGTTPEPDLVEALCVARPLTAIVENVVLAIDSFGKQQGGGHDNLTLAMVELPEAGVQPVPAPAMESAPAASAPSASARASTEADGASWQLADEEDPAGEYAIDEETDGLIRPPMTLAEKMAVETAGGPVAAPAAAPAPAPPPADKVPEEISRKLRRRRIWLISCFCVLAAIIGLIIRTRYQDANVPSAKSKNVEDKIITDSVSVEDLKEIITENPAKVINSGEDGVAQSPTGETSQAPAELSGIKERIDEEFSSHEVADDPESQNPAVTPPAPVVEERIPRSNTGDPIIDVLTNLKALKEFKGTPLSKANNPVEFSNRQQDRSRLVDEIKGLLNNYRRTLPPDNEKKKMIIDNAKKALSQASLKQIDENQGFPTQPAVDEINRVISNVERLK